VIIYFKNNILIRAIQCEYSCISVLIKIEIIDELLRISDKKQNSKND